MDTRDLFLYAKYVAAENGTLTEKRNALLQNQVVAEAVLVMDERIDQLKTEKASDTRSRSQFCLSSMIESVEEAKAKLLRA